ncbi:MAG: zinc-dependent metalloprotease [Actinomycetota bacterium]|nr:zinc-dependent metalloprotease [Actinomycetota bacterium]
MSASVDWDLARVVAGKVSSRSTFDRGGTDSSYLVPGLDRELQTLTAQAEELVAAETRLVSLEGPARSKVTDRRGWVDANLSSFDRLLRPLLDKLSDDDSEVGTGRFARLTEPLAGSIGPRLAGIEMGALLGWMSTRVIGQYDLLIIEDERPEDQDWVYYVAPNVLGLERRYGFEPSQFRLWIAIHECTHRAQFTGVPWLRPYFLSLVDGLIDSVDPDPERVFATIRAAVDERRARRADPDAEGALDGGIARLLASPEQKMVLDQVTGLMSLLEGHGDVTMDRAGRDLIPSQPRFARVLSERRANASGPARLFQKLLGFEAKLAQYAEGEAFIAAVEGAGGRELFDQVWKRAENLPTIDEIRNPELWIGRVNASTSV